MGSELFCPRFVSGPCPYRDEGTQHVLCACIRQTGDAHASALQMQDAASGVTTRGADYSIPPHGECVTYKT